MALEVEERRAKTPLNGGAVLVSRFPPPALPLSRSGLLPLPSRVCSAPRHRHLPQIAMNMANKTVASLSIM